MNGRRIIHIEIPVDDMFPLLETANFLEIKDLVRLMVKAVALQIQGKKAAEICETFGMDPSGIEELDDENAYLGSKIQQTKMLVTCQRFGDLFLFGLIWQYSSNHKTYNKGWFKVLATYL